MLTPSCTPAWLGRPPRMLTPFGASMTLASSRIVACRPPPPDANVSISLPLMVSVGASVPSFDTTGLCGDDLDALRDAFDRQIDRHVGRSPGRDIYCRRSW